ncbi:MAG TPA: hypothetical protein VIL74_08820 [Pyrinomonadaceae bacterium]|jgi:hypothetical protein
MKIHENEYEITFEYKTKWGKNELEVSEVSGDFEFSTENDNGDRAVIYLTKEEVKDLIKFLQSKT